MAVSTIKITFTQDLAIGAQLGFDLVVTNPWTPPASYSLIFDWKSLRSSPYQVTASTSPTINVGERTAINFVTAFNLDTGGQYLVFRTLNEVTIVAPNSHGSLTEFYVNGIFATYTNHPSIEFEITNGNAVAFSISSMVFSQATNACSEINATITTNELATKITSPVVVNPNTNNPFVLTFLRGQVLTLSLENATGSVINDLVETPSLLSDSNFTLEINNSPFGATVIINSVNSEGLDLQYSLDNTTWRTDNIFEGLPVSDYTLYVKDQYGCSFTKTFTVNEFGIYTPYFKISKSNSFRFANRIDFGDSANYKTDENTLSCEVDVPFPTFEIQRFNSADVITTQFESNFATNTAVVIKSDQTEVNIPIVKKTNNIGLKDKRDARKYNLGGGKTGIYFMSGNRYDYDTNIVVETYALNGLKPEWAEVGNYISIGSSFFLIEDVVFDESKNADIIVINNTYTGAEVNVIVGSVYNRFNKEVYEFTIDMNAYIDQKFRVRIVAEDPHFTTITHLTELIWCKVKWEKVFAIEYYNTTNTDMLYSTGIKHLIRIPYIAKRGRHDGSSELHKTDTDAILLNADLYEMDEIQFQPVTKEIWRKLLLALTHEEITIDGVRYIRNGDFNSEGPLGDTNDYVLTATMLKRGTVYNSQTSGNQDFDSTAVEVPGIIETDSGFVRY